MFDDPIVNEVRAARDEFARRFDYDLAAICEELRRLERESGRTYVSFPPRPSLAGAPPAATKHEPIGAK